MVGEGVRVWKREAGSLLTMHVLKAYLPAYWNLQSVNLQRKCKQVCEVIH